MQASTSSNPRSLEITVENELITIELNPLDPNPHDVLELLRDAACDNISTWTILAAEYLKLGYVDAAERIALAAVERYKQNGVEAGLPQMYALLANIHIAQSRQAPKIILQEPRYDDQKSSKSKDEYCQEATKMLNTAGSELVGTLGFLTRGVVQLASRLTDDAHKTFDGVLAEKPTNLVALLAKARILYSKRQYPQSLKIYQRVLRLNPSCKPDPRIGIGLCLWAMDDKPKARAAWQRSLEVNPDAWPSQLLLGIDCMNTGRPLETEEQQESYRQGTKMTGDVFKKHNKNAAAANILSYLQLQKTSHDPKLLPQSMKLAERTIQFADTLTILTEGYIRAARAAQAEGSYSQALSLFTSAASRTAVPSTLAVLGQAQIHIQNDEIPAAIHALDSLLQKMPSASRSLEVSVILASLRFHPRPGVSSSETASERRKARELYDKALHSLASSFKSGPSQSSAMIARDTEMYVEIARLWQGENLEKVTKATQDAIKTREMVDQKPGMTDAKLFNNLGALKHLEGEFSEAMTLYEHALTVAISQKSQEGMETSVLYNLARVYEDQGELDLAKEAYDKLLSEHPEYIDAKLRLVHMLQLTNKFNDAHLLLKQCLTSQISNTNLRAFYTYFLIQTNSPKAAKDFVFATLREHDKHDLYALCAAGFVQYNQCRESRDTSAKGVDERKKGFARAAELFDKALSLDPMCAVAAQGLAIITAEDALVTLSGLPALHGAEEAQRRSKLFLEALDVFSKVRESIDDGSVYANMGHCYYSCDEFDRAIEHYETASERYHAGQNPAVLLCLCRSWYAKANKDQSHSAMSQSLKYAQKALHIRPGDKAILYNIATIEQKIAQMLFALPPKKRSMADLRDAVAHAEHAQTLFASLANDKSDVVPYSRDIADQRRKFGDTLLRRKEEQLENQRAHEEESQAKLAAARQKRQEEKDRLDALERVRLEAKKVEAEKLAEERRKAREEAQKWTKDMQIESDDERERRASKKVRKKPDGVQSGDEGASGQGEPKKKRKTKLKKADGQDAGGDLFSDDEDVEKQVKKRSAKKRVVRDEEDDAAVAAGGPPRKKQFKSKEVLSDTDDEMDQE